jgi:MOSC domain-containing protein YiiM
MSGGARIVQICVSPGGVPKQPVASARVSSMGVRGDAHRNRTHHGGPERALCLFSQELIRALQAEGHPIQPGSIGENLTIEGLDWSKVVPGLCLRLGDDVLIEVTTYTAPCFKIRASFRDRDEARVSQKRHPGHSRVYARVLREGSIATGDPVRLLTSAEANALVAPA